MGKTIISEGKTTNEAIENGLKKLNVSKNSVDVKVIESGEKRSFFSILAPRVVKVELTLKDDVKPEQQLRHSKANNDIQKHKKEIILSKEEQEKAKQNVEKFLADFVKTLPEGTTYKSETSKEYVFVNLINKDLGYLIGYRGETLYALQNLLTAMAGKGIENKVRVILDIEGYKEKREKTLEELAQKVANTVIKTRKPIKLEPMQAYERKIIHSTLQKNYKVETTSIGEEPYRRVVISLKK